MMAPMMAATTNPGDEQGAGIVSETKARAGSTGPQAAKVKVLDPNLSIYLDLLRLVAAFEVVLGHARHFVMPGLPGFISGHTGEAVAVFFVLSGFVIAFVAVTLLGFLTANLVGRSVVEFGEVLLARTPVISGLYKGLRQIFETLFSANGTSFRTVGLVEFPVKGTWSVVFVSAPAGPDVQTALGEENDHVGVFLPCALAGRSAFEPCNELRQTLRRHIGEVDERIAALETSRAMLESILAAM